MKTFKFKLNLQSDVKWCHQLCNHNIGLSILPLIGQVNYISILPVTELLRSMGLPSTVAVSNSAVVAGVVGIVSIAALLKYLTSKNGHRRISLPKVKLLFFLSVRELHLSLQVNDATIHTLQTASSQ